jgi:hypothetical protein
MVNHGRRQISEHDVFLIAEPCDVISNHERDSGNPPAFGWIAADQACRAAKENVLVKAASSTRFEYRTINLKDLPYRVRLKIGERKAGNDEVVLSTPLNQFNGLVDDTDRRLYAAECRV